VKYNKAMLFKPTLKIAPHEGRLSHNYVVRATIPPVTYLLLGDLGDGPPFGLFEQLERCPLPFGR